MAASRNFTKAEVDEKATKVHHYMFEFLAGNFDDQIAILERALEVVKNFRDNRKVKQL